MKILSVVLLSLVLQACKPEKEKIHTGHIRFYNSSIFYQVSGEGAPVFLAHAGFQDHKMWEEQRKVLVKNGFKVIAVDMAGHGASDPADTNYLAEHMIKACFDSLRIEKATLVGLSLGGATVTDFALAYPDRVHKLVLVSSLATGYDKYYPVDSFTRTYYPTLREALDKKDIPAAAEVFTKYWADGLRKPGETPAAVRKYVYETTLRSMQMHGYDKWARFSKLPGIERISSLKMPVLIIYGDKDLKVINDAANVLGSKIPNSKVVGFKNVAHMLNMEIPEEFNKTLLDFLK